MNTSKQIAKHFKEVYFGGNWTSSNIKSNLEGLSWKQATTKIGDLNTIATLTYHMHYYVAAVTKVLEGEALKAKDAYSFDHPPFEDQMAWDSFLEEVWNTALKFTDLVSELPTDVLHQDFEDAKYGNYYRNLHGIIEHCHYHLGQIAIIKKMLLSK